MRENTPMGATQRMIPEVRRIIAWKAEAARSARGSRWRGGRPAMLRPTRMAKKMMESIFASEAASTMLTGTMSRRRSTGEVTTVRSGSCRVSAAPRSAPAPGLTRLTRTSPVRTARKLVAR